MPNSHLRHQHHRNKVLRCAVLFTVLVVPALSVVQLLTRPFMETSTLSWKRSMTSILDAPPPPKTVAATATTTNSSESLIPTTTTRRRRRRREAGKNDERNDNSNQTIPKTSRFRQRRHDHHQRSMTSPSSSSRQQRLPFCLVHIGKTAGGSVSCRLGGAPRLAKQCPSTTNNDNQASLLGPYCVGKLHKQRDWGCFAANNHKKNKKVWRSQDSNSSIHPTTTINIIHHNGSSIHTFLYTLRDPIDRLRSWFYYEHPSLHNVQEPMGARRDLFLACHYSTLDELAQLGLQVALNDGTNNNHNISLVVDDNDGENQHELAVVAVDQEDPRISPTCALRAWKAVTGQTGYLYHNRFNYQYYYDWTRQLLKSSTSRHGDIDNQPPKLRVLVIRQEHLSEDWNSLEDMYADDADDGTTTTARQRALASKQQRLSKGGPSSETTTGNDNKYFDVVKLHQVGDDHNNKNEQESNRRDKNNKPPHKNHNPLSRASWPNLCQALCRDILVYRELLERAENLQHWQRKMSLRELATKCPEQAARPLHQVTCRPDPTFSNVGT